MARRIDQAKGERLRRREGEKTEVQERRLGEGEEPREKTKRTKKSRAKRSWRKESETRGLGRFREGAGEGLARAERAWCPLWALIC